MAHTDLAQMRPISPAQQLDQGKTETLVPLVKPYLMTGVYSVGNIDNNNACGTNLMPTPRQTLPQITTMALEQYRLQLYNYAFNIERLRCPQYASAAGTGLGVNSSTVAPWLRHYSSHCAGTGGNRLATLSTISLFPQSRRIFQPEDPKPQHSYIGLIAMAILSSSEVKLVLSDIYQYILDNYPYFRTRGPGWRNSIRHNLSLNDCFIKSGRSANGKGHYWAIHPANMDDFRNGDFRRRKAQRKVRKHMGLTVDDAGTDSPSPPPLDLTTPPPAADQASMQLSYPYHQHYIDQLFRRGGVGSPACKMPQYSASTTSATTATALQRHQIHIQQPELHTLPRLDPNYPQTQHQHQHIAYINSTTTTTIANLYSQSRKRQFDVASLLAPDVQIVDEEGSSPSATRTTTQHTVITEVQVQKQQTVQRDMVAEQSSVNQIDGDADGDIDVDGDEDEVGEETQENNAKVTFSNHDLSNSHVIQQMISPDDNNSYLSDARRSSLDAYVEDSEANNFSVSVASPLDGSSVSSSSQNDSFSLEESSQLLALTSGALSASSKAPLTPPIAMTMSLPKAYIELNHVNPHILSRYYGTYMAAAARHASLESRVQTKSMTTSPPIEMLPNKS